MVSLTSTLTITGYEAPVIVTQPQNQSVTAGGTATFAVEATGHPMPQYQWQVCTNGYKISGIISRGKRQILI